ncbi:MAG: hypothetical protein ACRESJ_01720 [Pseudomonas sp.]|uniref:hypothetical protein n=1 Tax=Pseudomonas sp. TaxID=306 RepID=UPI003D6EC466
MNNHSSSNLIVMETIPSNCAYAENHLQQTLEQLAYLSAINAGIVDADAGKLTCLETVKAKWLSR